MPIFQKMAGHQGGGEMYSSLVETLNSFMKKRPNYGLNEFSEESGVSVRTLNRFKNNLKLSESSVVAIVCTLFKDDMPKIIEVLTEYFPDDKNPARVKEWFESQELLMEQDEYLKEFSSRDKVHYQIYHLLTYEHGVSEQKVVFQFGEYGRIALEELKGKGKIVDARDGVRLLNNKPGFFEGKNLKKHGRLAYESFEESTFATSDSQLAHFNGFTTLECFGRQKEILSEAVLKCLRLQRENKGNIPCVISTTLIKLPTILGSYAKREDMI